MKILHHKFLTGVIAVLAFAPLANVQANPTIKHILAQRSAELYMETYSPARTAGSVLVGAFSGTMAGSLIGGIIKDQDPQVLGALAFTVCTCYGVYKGYTYSHETAQAKAKAELDTITVRNLELQTIEQRRDILERMRALANERQ